MCILSCLISLLFLPSIPSGLHPGIPPLHRPPAERRVVGRSNRQAASIHLQSTLATLPLCSRCMLTCCGMCGTDGHGRDPLQQSCALLRPQSCKFYSDSSTWANPLWQTLLQNVESALIIPSPRSHALAFGLHAFSLKCLSADMACMRFPNGIVPYSR